jgi:hypothetical protein
MLCALACETHAPLACTRLTGLALALALALACALPARAQAPEARTTTVPLERFDAIEISGSAMVRFTQGTAEQVVVEGGDDARARELFEIRDGRLRIHAAGAWRFWEGRRVRIDVTARELSRVSISGAADFVATSPVRTPRLAVSISGAGAARFERLDAESLSFDVSGAGDGHVAGTTRELKVRIAGRSELAAEELRAERASVSISGVGDVRLWVVRELEVNVAGAGRVHYWGTPSVRRHVTGAATLSERGPKTGLP